MKAVKRAIILCWIMLIVCFIIKLFGGNWFEIICNNEHFINICKFIDEHLILNYCLSFPVYAIPTYFIVLSCCVRGESNLAQKIVVLIFVVGVWASQFIFPWVKLILEIVMFLALPTILCLMKRDKTNRKQEFKKSWYLGIIACAIILVFQLISLLVKNIGIKVIDESLLTSIMFSIDYYIMTALYCLYIKLKHKKEEIKNG